MHTRPSPQSIPRRLRQTDRRNRVSGVAWATSAVHSERDRVDVGPHSPGFATFVAERRRGDFGDSVERANIYAEHAQTSDSSGAAAPYIGRCELPPTTAVRPRAQVKYSKRFHAAYGHHRSRARVPRPSSSTMSLALRADRPRDLEFPLTVTSLARPRRSHRRATPSFLMDSPPKPNDAGPRHERPLAKELENRGITVWLDETELRVGVRLRRSIRARSLKFY